MSNELALRRMERDRGAVRAGGEGCPTSLHFAGCREMGSAVGTREERYPTISAPHGAVSAPRESADMQRGSYSVPCGPDAKAAGVGQSVQITKI